MLIRIAVMSIAAAAPVFADGPKPVASPSSAPPAAYSNATDWSGPYAGLVLGAISLDGEAARDGYAGPLLTLDVQNGLFPDSIHDDGRAAIAGLRYGYNRQSGTFVTGFEIDLSLSGADTEAGFSRVDPNPDPMYNGTDTITGYRTVMDSFVTARLRAGYAAGPWFMHASGGIAGSKVDNTLSLSLPNLNGGTASYANHWSDEGWRPGYVFGAGIERRVGERVSIAADVMRFDLQDNDIKASDPSVFGANEITYEFGNAGYLARIGINFAF